MKGVVFNLVEDAVVSTHGEAAWDALLQRAGLDGCWTAIGNYPSRHLLALVAAGSAMLDVEPDDLTRDLGRHAVLALADRNREFFTPHPEVTSLLFSLNDVIHPEVRKLNPEANPPRFDFVELGPDDLLVSYHSHRPLCALADGMIRGAATWYGQRAAVVHDACTRQGAPHCRLRCTFTPAVCAATGTSGSASGRPAHGEREAVPR